MAKYGPVIRTVGTSARPSTAIGAHNFERDYYKHSGASGDVRAVYADLNFTSTGSGETIRVRGIADSLLSAAGGTINAIHATGRVAAAKTVAGSLNGIRATLEVAGTNPTPGGKLAALRVDTNIVTNWTAGATDALISVGQNGAGKVTNFISFDDAVGNHDSTTTIVMESAAYAASDLIRAVKCVANGEVFYLIGTTTAPKA